MFKDPLKMIKLFWYNHLVLMFCGGELSHMLHDIKIYTGRA